MISLLVISFDVRASHPDLPLYGVRDLHNIQQFPCRLVAAHKIATHLKIEKGSAKRVIEQIAVDIRSNFPQQLSEYHAENIARASYFFLRNLSAEQRLHFLGYSESRLRHFFDVYAVGLGEQRPYYLHAMKLFQKFSPQMEWKRQFLFVDSIANISRIAKQAGVSDVDQMRLQFVREKALAALSEEKVGLAANVAHFIRENQDSMIACIAGGGCRVSPAYQSLGEFGRTIEFLTVGEFTDYIAINRANSFVSPRDIRLGNRSRWLDAILLTAPKGFDLDVASWVGHYYRDLSNRFVYTLLSQWLRANVLLAQKGLKTDPVFADNVRFARIKDDRFLVIFKNDFYQFVALTIPRFIEYRVNNAILWSKGDRLTRIGEKFAEDVAKFGDSKAISDNWLQGDPVTLASSYNHLIPILNIMDNSLTLARDNFGAELFPPTPTIKSRVRTREILAPKP